METYSNAFNSAPSNKSHGLQSPRLIELQNPIKLFAPAFERYITIHGLDGNRTYDYVTDKRNFRGCAVVRFTRHARKCCADESWLYVALAANAIPATLTDQDKLYIGSQTQDRMFRAGVDGSENFHHAQMRCARKVNGVSRDGETRGLVAHLRAGGGEVEIFRASREALLRVIRTDPRLGWLKAFCGQEHFGKVLESLVLYLEPPHEVWQWNTKGPDKQLARELEEACRRT